MQLPSTPTRFFFEGQIVHLLLLLVLLVGACLLLDFKQLAERRVLGVGAHVWFVISLAVPIVHQVYVRITWRSEICFGTVTKRLGSHAFVIYQIVFMVLFLARPISLTLLAIANHDSFKMSILVRVVICAILGVPAVYTLYSVVHYFGIYRAAGIDHFDESYRTKPLVKEGIFKYASNSMYSFAFLTLWVIAIAGASWAGLVVALFIAHFCCLGTWSIATPARSRP